LLTQSGNQDGWFFMQRVLENVAPDVINGNRTLIALGSDPNTRPLEQSNPH
jgi:hypothetical protein